MFKQFHYILSRIMMFGVMIATGKMIATLMMNAFFASPQKWHLHAQILAPDIGQRPRHMTIPQTLAIHNCVCLLWPSDSASKQRLPTANRKAASAALTSSSSATSACDADAQAPCRQGILEIVAMVTANITGNDTILPARSFNKHSLLLRIAELINAMGNPWKTMASYPKRRRGLATWLKTMIICFGNIVIAI